jgi:RNA polymerase sigma factor (sigma-70 family)
VTEFERVYRMYFKDVFLYLISISGDEQIAEDITSETFLKALKSIDSFKGNCDIRVWLCQIAKNTYFSHIRKQKKYPVQELPIQLEDKVNLEQSICSAETSMQVHKILHNLKEPYKEVFSLRVFGELSFKQIAALFGKTENWACVTFHRARKKIQVRMEDYR